jgi:alkanesulfonate monooxygenase SsuD/methylene tetrahydromethanopterin reductase-like flavin-dependent oxidoreductase (luciferase family)
VRPLTRPGIVGIALDSSIRRYQRALEVADLAEANGIDLVTAPDHPFSPRELEVWTFLTTISARTTRLSVATNVASVALRPAAMLAKAAVTLQVVSGGRAALGVGGGGVLDQIEAFGGQSLTTRQSIDGLEEALGLIRAAWAGSGSREPLAFDGTYHRLSGAAFGPEPPSPVPLWVGSFAPRTLRLTGEYADGWLPTNLYLELADVPSMQSRISAAAESAGRSPSDVRRIFNVMGSIDTHAPVENGRRVVGSPEHWIAALTDYHERLGFDGLVFWPVFGDPFDQARRFVEEIRPKLPPLFQPAA